MEIEVQCPRCTTYFEVSTLESEWVEVERAVSEHTPGPWTSSIVVHVNDVEIRSIVGPDSELVLSAGYGANAQPYVSCRSVADTELIAAAPELLAACKAVLSHSATCAVMPIETFRKVELAIERVKKGSEHV